jgi:hypothetical protein
MGIKSILLSNECHKGEACVVNHSMICAEYPCAGCWIALRANSVGFDSSTSLTVNKLTTSKPEAETIYSERSRTTDWQAGYHQGMKDTLDSIEKNLNTLDYLMNQGVPPERIIERLEASK